MPCSRIARLTAASAVEASSSVISRALLPPIMVTRQRCAPLLETLRFMTET